MKKLFLSGAALFLTIVLAACGGDGDGKDTDTDADTGIDTDAISDTDSDASGIDTDSVVGDNTPPDDGVGQTVIYRLLSLTESNDGKVSKPLKYGYDDKGRLIYVREDGETEPMVTVTYGEDGMVSEILDASDSLDNRFRFENGKLISRGTYLRGGTTPITSADYIYDDTGRLVTCCEYGDDGGVESQTDYVLVLDDDGNIAEEHIVDGISGAVMAICEYDSEGRVIKDSFYASGGDAPYNIIEYEYDENGDIISITEYDPSKAGSEGLSVTRREEYEYDKDGNLISMTLYNQSEAGDEELSLLQRSEYVYNEEGELVTEKLYGADEAITLEYTYANGLLTSIEHLYGADEQNITRETYQYDNDGNLISFMYSDVREHSIGEEYTYRAFEVTEEELLLIGENDAIINQYVSVSVKSMIDRLK